MRYGGGEGCPTPIHFRETELVQESYIQLKENLTEILNYFRYLKNILISRLSRNIRNLGHFLKFKPTEHKYVAYHFEARDLENRAT